MIASLMLRAVVAAGLLSLVALCADGVARQFGLPRRWIWAGALLSSLALPLAGGLLPALGLLERSGLRGATSAAAIEELQVLREMGEPLVLEPATIEAIGGQMPLGEMLNTGLLALWIAGSALLLALLVWSGWGLRIARRRGEPARIAGVPAVVAAGGFGPAVVGVLRPEVLLPAWVRDLPPLERRIVAAHEWEHVRARDTLLLALAAAVLVAAPWNLVLWWQHRRLRDAIETDCDARLIARGIDRRAYGQVLLSTAGRSRSFPLLSPSLARSRSTLERRILAMTYRAPKHRIARAVGLLALAGVSLAAACDFASTRPASGPANPLGPAAAAESDHAVPTPSAAPAETPEAVSGGAFATTVAEGTPGELLIVDASEDPARVEVTRSPAGTAEGGAVLRARRVSVTGEGDPIYFVDGVRVDAPELDSLDIVRVEVVKGAAAVQIYGEEAAEGVIRITTRAADQVQETSAQVESAARQIETSAERVLERARMVSAAAGAAPIYFVDGVRVESVDMETLDIESVEVVKGAAARAIAGAEAAGGVVHITTKGQQLSARIHGARERLSADVGRQTFATPEEEIAYRIRGIIRAAFAAAADGA